MDALFFGGKIAKKALVIYVGNHTDFDSESRLELRIGPELFSFSVGTDTLSDIIIEPQRLVMNISVAINRRIQGTVLTESSSRRILIIPTSEMYMSASYPKKGAIRTEIISVAGEPVLGDINLVNSDIQMVSRNDELLQDMTMRLISSRFPNVGWSYSLESGSGWDRYMGRAITKSLIEEMEREFLSALRRDGVHNISRVRLFPIGRDALQPVVYMGNKAVDIGYQINLTTGQVVLT